MESTKNYNHHVLVWPIKCILKCHVTFQLKFIASSFHPFFHTHFTATIIRQKFFSLHQNGLFSTNPNSLEIKNLYKMVHFTLIPLFVWKLLQNFIISYNRYVYQGSPDSRTVPKTGLIFSVLFSCLRYFYTSPYIV